MEPLEPPIPPDTNESDALKEPTGFTNPSEHSDGTEVNDENAVARGRSRTSWIRLSSFAAVLLLVAVVLIIALSSSSPTALTPREAVIAAETAAAKPTTSSFSLAASINTTEGNSFQVVNDPLTLTGDGAIDRVTHSMVMNMKIKVATLTIHLREILSKKSVYVKFGALTPYLRSGKTWIQVPSTLIGSKSSIANIGTSPLILQQIRKKEIKITADGSALVNGTKLSLYKLRPDVALTRELAGSSGSGTDGERFSVTYVLGIDAQHILRQVRGSIVRSVGNTHQLENLSMTFLSDNQPVVIEKPSTKETEILNASQYAKLVKRAQAAPPSLV
jgi:hypothetical protein